MDIILSASDCRGRAFSRVYRTLPVSTHILWIIFDYTPRNSIRYIVQHAFIPRRWRPMAFAGKRTRLHLHITPFYLYFAIGGTWNIIKPLLFAYIFVGNKYEKLGLDNFRLSELSYSSSILASKIFVLIVRAKYNCQSFGVRCDVTEVKSHVRCMSELSVLLIADSLVTLEMLIEF